LMAKFICILEFSYSKVNKVFSPEWITQTSMPDVFLSVEEYFMYFDWVVQQDCIFFFSYVLKYDFQACPK
jgi:hypothetical protein